MAKVLKIRYLGPDITTFLPFFKNFFRYNHCPYQTVQTKFLIKKVMISGPTYRFSLLLGIFSILLIQQKWLSVLRRTPIFCKKIDRYHFEDWPNYENKLDQVFKLTGRSLIILLRYSGKKAWINNIYWNIYWTSAIENDGDYYDSLNLIWQLIFE